MSAAEKIEDAIQWTPVRSWKTNPSEPGILFTPQEYLRREAAADTKHEYIAGHIYAMAGGSPEHSGITSDTQFALEAALRASGRPCRTYNSDLKVRVSDAGPFYYPDITIVCGENVTDEDGCLRNPIVIVEVLSDTTEARDRGRKFLQYQRIASFQHYVLISQDIFLVEHYAKNQEGLWTLVGVHTTPDDILSLPDLKIAIPLKEIYRHVLPELERTNELHP